MLGGGFLDVGSRQPQELDNVLIVERIEDLPAGAARPDEPHPSQEPQLVRHGGFADPYEPGDVAHAQLARCQRVENADTRRVAEHAEGVGDGLDGPGLEENAAPRGTRAPGQVREITVEIGDWGHMSQDWGHMYI